MKLMAFNEHRPGAIVRQIRYFSLMSGVLIFSAAGLFAKPRHSRNQPNAPPDEIAVVAHVPLTGGAITRFLTTEHYRREYLYAEHESGKAVTMIDVTNIEAPSVLADVPYASSNAAQLVAVTGNAALIASTDSAAPEPASSQTFRVMSFADPLHPTVKEEFAGVTAMAIEDKRGLIFLANPQGVWILQQRYAMDPQSEKEWEHMMLDDR